MILFSRAKPHREVWCGATNPLLFVNVETGEMSSDVETMERPGALFIFASLPDALESLALKLSERGTLEIYGDSLSAAWWRIGGRSGVRLTGLQGYGGASWQIDRVIEFWKFLSEICNAVGTSPGATPGTTALRIVAATTPRQISNHGRRIQTFAKNAFSAGARHSKPGQYAETFLYDIHSAFPHAMKNDLPFGDAIRTQRDDGFYIAELTFDYESEFNFSPAWLRASDGKIYHPQAAKNVTAILNSIDIETLNRCGTLKILKVHKRYRFDCEPLLEPAQTYLAQWQKQVPQFRTQIKILRNSIYGKLAQQQTQKRYTLKRIDDIHAAIATRQMLRDYNAGEYGLFQYQSSGRPFTHFPVAGAITAMVRAQVYAAIDKNSIAVRTDAILSRRRRNDLDIGPLDGQWSIKESGAAVVFGQSGFVIENDKSHLDGVQAFENGIAHAARRDRFAFGEEKEISIWIPAIESQMRVTAIGEKLKIHRGRQEELLDIVRGDK